jgi:hypothetical protein
MALIAELERMKGGDEPFVKVRIGSISNISTIPLEIRRKL